jgi:hypothetical protein
MTTLELANATTPRQRRIVGRRLLPASDDFAVDAVLANTIVAQIMIISRGPASFTASVTVANGLNRSTGRILKGTFPTEALAWDTAVAEGRRMLNRMFEERDLG